MFLVKKWTVRLYNPMIVGTSLFGIDRIEVIDTLTLEMLPAGAPHESAEEVARVSKAIDWPRSDDMLPEEFAACDLAGAIRLANHDAQRRAETYCGYVKYCREHGRSGTHAELMAEWRIFKRDETIAQLRLVHPAPADDAA